MRRSVVLAAVWLSLVGAAVGVGLVVGQWWALAGLGAGLVVGGVSTAALLFFTVDADPPARMIRSIDGRPRATDRRAG